MIYFQGAQITLVHNVYFVMFQIFFSFIMNNSTPPLLIYPCILEKLALKLNLHLSNRKHCLGIKLWEHFNIVSLSFKLLHVFL